MYVEPSELQAGKEYKIVPISPSKERVGTFLSLSPDGERAWFRFGTTRDSVELERSIFSAAPIGGKMQKTLKSKKVRKHKRKTRKH